MEKKELILENFETVKNLSLLIYSCTTTIIGMAIATAENERFDDEEEFCKLKQKGGVMTTIRGITYAGAITVGLGGIYWIARKMF